MEPDKILITITRDKLSGIYDYQVEIEDELAEQGQAWETLRDTLDEVLLVILLNRYETTFGENEDD